MPRLPELLRASSALQRLGVVFLTSAVLSACGGAPPAADGPPGGGPPGGMALPVDMVTLAAEPVEQATEFVATVKSRRTATIQPQVEGILTEIRVTSGERVQPGATLFTIDSTTQEAAVSALRSQRAARESDATYARQQVARARLLLDAGAMSEQEFEQAEAQSRNAEAQLTAIDEQIRQQQAELAYYQVKAPTAGSIGDVPVRVGDRVTRSTMLTTVDDNAGLEVYVQVPVQQAPNLRVGLPVQLLDDAGAVIATERLSYVASSVDESTQTVLAKATVRGNRFRSDQFVRVRLVWSMEPTLTVPLVSVLRISGQQFVYVAEPGDGGMLIARLRSVQLGPVVGADYVVLGGVSAGDRLITSGIQKIGDGAPVQALPPGGMPAGGPPGGPGDAPAGAGEGGGGSL